MDTKEKVIQRKDIELIVVPCPRCRSWMTSPVDKKRSWWFCGHMDCMATFVLKNHHALVFLKDKKVIRIDEKHKYKIQ